MTGPMIPLSDLPTWPRLMSEEEAARYVGVSRNTFRGFVGSLWPKPIKFGRRLLYDRAALDRAVDLLSTTERKSPGDRIRQGRENDSGGALEAR